MSGEQFRFIGSIETVNQLKITKTFSLNAPTEHNAIVTKLEVEVKRQKDEAKRQKDKVKQLKGKQGQEDKRLENVKKNELKQQVIKIFVIM
jgi:uncharacterized protein (UPF0371 family)